jgi:hypothetical protein
MGEQTECGRASGASQTMRRKQALKESRHAGWNVVEAAATK